MTARFHTLVLLTVALAARAEEPEFDEYHVKAAFLYNFSKFVEWPPSAFASPREPIAICIAGQDPFGPILDDLVRGKKIGDRDLVVKRLPDARQASSCQILFIGAAERKRAHALLEGLPPYILTVGETPDFTAQGGIVAFALEGTHLRFQIALETAQRAKLHISSKLLSLAEIVKGP